ncbi:MAG: hypothetical protein QNI95_14670 [Desulfobacterales bacterium]|nr:hypothetical protein [Desulfobacterales bacterium]
MMEQELIRNNFDFNVGSLIKSPCRDCETFNMPDCLKSCQMMKEVQLILAQGVSSTTGSGHDEVYEIPDEARDII